MLDPIIVLFLLAAAFPTVIIGALMVTFIWTKR